MVDDDCGGSSAKSEVIRIQWVFELITGILLDFMLDFMPEQHGSALAFSLSMRTVPIETAYLR